MASEIQLNSDRLLKSIRHFGSRVYKGLPPQRLISDVQRIRDLCNELLELWGVKRDE